MSPLTNHYDFAHQYLNLASNSIDEMETRNNINFSMITSTGDDIKDEQTHDERRKWSDIKVALPIAFCFYHGVELFMKALLFDLNIKHKKNHKLTGLLTKIKGANDKSLKDVLKILNDILANTPFENHFSENKKSIDEYYHILKYAEDLDGNFVSIGTLIGKEELGLDNFIIIRNQIFDLRKELIKWKKSQFRK